ncbi:hypothetical protein PRIPAC_70796 [Pristionchus pacificus]|uniref:Uncharacterized protein n=1 Tax=Pristionchus pacificus TaxID=54126 RepID=A0A2A6BET2_PRIPA|nr:hypothetical protein PRIPAC_70796 [Pristionchus pacificus]|eukprot:PDM64366.1 hypothetical protein PRIPAC_52622 [Pristionchus pacificus]
MAEWDGIRLRALFEGNVPGLLDVMVQMLVASICDLVRASQNLRDPTAMREPLLALVSVMATQMPVFIIDPYKHQLYLMGRMFARNAMIVIHLYEQLGAPNAAEFDELMGWFTFPDGLAPPSILQQPIRMSAKRKLVFSEEERPTSPKRKLLIPKEEVVSPIVATEKRRSTRIVDDDEMEEVEDAVEKKKCDHCNLEVPVSEMEQLKHAWKKHKELVHKYIRPELMCTIDYCDYVSTSVNVRKIHVGRYHGIKPLAQRRVVSELKEGCLELDEIISTFHSVAKCPYCSTDIASIADLKQHVLQCTQRDERPMLGCSFCPKEKFHFIYDFSAHLKKFGGVTHGKPVVLSYN